jgi:hypothetical protein
LSYFVSKLFSSSHIEIPDVLYKLM